MDWLKRILTGLVILAVLGSLGFLIFKDMQLQKSLNATNKSLTALSAQVKQVGSRVNGTDGDVESTDSDVQYVCSSISTCF